jgi:hypothetical protein
MAKFFLGQPIKKVRGDHNVGVTGRVHSFARIPNYMLVRLDAPSISVNMKTGEVIGQREAGSVGYTVIDHWEPILPDGHRPSEFETLHDLLDSLERETA